VAYAPDVQAALEAAHASGAAKADVTVRGRPYAIVLKPADGGPMRQVSSEGAQRKVRRHVEAPRPTGSAVWEIQLESGFVAYDAAAQAVLESAYQAAQDRAVIQARGQPYQIVFDDMVQVSQRGNAMRIRRRATGGGTDGTPAAAPARAPVAAISEAGSTERALKSGAPAGALRGSGCSERSAECGAAETGY
jgi:hypothetical protein